MFNGTLDPDYPPGNPFTLRYNSSTRPAIEFLKLSFSADMSFAARYGPEYYLTNRLIELVDSTSFLNCALSYALLATFEIALFQFLATFTVDSYDQGGNGDIFDLEGYSEQQTQVIRDTAPAMSSINVNLENAAVGVPNSGNFATIGIQHNIIPTVLTQLHAFVTFYPHEKFLSLLFIISSDELPSR